MTAHEGEVDPALPRSVLCLAVLQLLASEHSRVLNVKFAGAVAVALLVAIAIIVYKLLGTAINDSNSITGSNIKTAKFP
jgi:hypothetical protein